MIRLVEAVPLEGYRLNVRFNDGVEGVYSVEPQRRGGVFQKILDLSVFNAVRINPDFDCIEWPGGVDLCPTSMHEEVLAAATQQRIISFVDH